MESQGMKLNFDSSQEDTQGNRVVYQQDGLTICVTPDGHMMLNEAL